MPYDWAVTGLPLHFYDRTVGGFCTSTLFAFVVGCSLARSHKPKSGDIHRCVRHDRRDHYASIARCVS
ncbi:hypothetical protein L6R29_17040 [Myxococcota bacterium]|nr:hypothetical protein [Myxococcota bacterium]